MRSYPKSTADVIGTAQALLKGAEGNADEMKGFGLKADELQAHLDAFVKTNALQEKLKGDLHQATADLAAQRKVILVDYGKWVSVLEGQYGKAKDKLQEFGIPPRQIRPKTGPRTPKPAQPAGV